MRVSVIGVVALAASASAAIGAPRESVTFNNVNSVGFQGNAANVTLSNTFTGADAGGAYNATYLTVDGTLGNRQGATFAREACILVTPPGGTPFLVQPFNIDGWTTTTTSVTLGRYAIPVGAFTTAGNWSFEFVELFDDVAGAGVDSTWQAITFTLDDGTPPAAPSGQALNNSQTMTWNGVDSDGVAATPGAQRTVVFNSGPAVNAIVISGSATARRGFSTSSTNCPLERMLVRVTPPSGAAVIATAFPHTSFSSDGAAITVGLPAAIDPAGTWTLDFYQATNDTGIDATWNTVALTVGTIPPPAATEITVPTDGTFGATAMTLAAGQTRWFTFSLVAPVSQAAGDWLDIDTETSLITDTAIGLYNAGGGLVTSDLDDGSGTLSQLTYGFGVRAPVGNGLAYNSRDAANLAAGTYFVAVTAGNTGVTFGASAWNVTNTNTNSGDAVLRIRRGSSATTTPPAATPIAIPGDGTFGVSTATLAAGETRWFSFTLASDIVGFAGDFLDIDTETSTITDTAIGLYSSAGVLVASDLDDGSGTLSQLSFGIGTRAAVGTSVAYNGRDGRFLAAGTYYVALAAGNTNVTFGSPFWFVGNFNANTGDAALRIRRGVMPPVGTAPAARDLGTLAGNLVVNTDENSQPLALAANEIKWFKFRLSSNATAAAGIYVDIDTEGTVLAPNNDTEIGLWSATGFLVVSDDDDGNGLLSQMSFGQTTPARPAVGTGVAYNGRDGALTTGIYYLSVSSFNSAFADGFAVTTPGANAGPLVVNINTNYPTGPTPCNAADVAGLGGTVGADHQLTADDLIVYLDAFFAGNLAIADIAVLGGTPGHDGTLTADDLIYFLDQFFRPCNP